MSISGANAVLELVIGVLVVLGAVKSLYNGYLYKYLIARLRRADEAHERVEQVDQKVNEVDQKLDRVLERQQLQTHAIVAVGMAANNPEEDFDHRRYRRVANEEGADQFLQDD